MVYNIQVKFETPNNQLCDKKMYLFSTIGSRFIYKLKYY